MGRDPWEATAALQGRPQARELPPHDEALQTSHLSAGRSTQRVEKRCLSFELPDPDLDSDPASVPESEAELKLEAELRAVSTHPQPPLPRSRADVAAHSNDVSFATAGRPSRELAPGTTQAARGESPTPLLGAPAQWDAPSLLDSWSRLPRQLFANVFPSPASVTQSLRLILVIS